MTPWHQLLWANYAQTTNAPDVPLQLDHRTLCFLLLRIIPDEALNKVLPFLQQIFRQTNQFESTGQLYPRQPYPGKLKCHYARCERRIF